MTLQPFEPNALPLSPGIRLLEASAGTGKTFALAHLVLRLVSEGSRPLAIEQLLVVTFTHAAAAELRDRIARRLQQALAQLEAASGHSEADDPAPPADLDQPLADWLAAQKPDFSPLLRGRVLLALEQLDRADITTIHGFCRRTLQRQALEAGMGPAVGLEADATERRGQIVHDYWQQQVLPLPAEHLAGLLSRGIEPERLAGVLQALDGDPALELDPLPEGVDVERSLAEQLQARWLASWQRFEVLWPRDAEALERNLATSTGVAKENGHSYKPYRLKPKADKRDAVSGWRAGLAGPPGYAELLERKELRDYFHPGPVQKLESVAHPEGARLPQAELLETIADLVDGPAELVLLHFAHWGRAELARRRQRSGEMGYGQLLEQLDPGEQGDTPLLRAIADRYRAALIDEFQDTDPIQWRILQGAFGGEPARHLLVMVGDPKQAIYRFRGGELATYRQAAGQAEACYGLIQNRRSSAGLIDGLNALMRPGLVNSRLEVPIVDCCMRDEALILEPGEAPLQLLTLEPAQLEAQVAAFCQGLLERQLQLVRGESRRPLEPSDLCLLVTTHREAETLRVALERRGLPSRLVNQGDVFASEGARALQRLLDALAEPGDPGRLRLLAASTLLGWSAGRIRSAPPEAWDQLADNLARLAERLPQQGLTAVVGQLLGSEALARLALRGRALADLQQAAELVQEQMHRQGLNTAATADWLRNLRLQGEREVPDAHRCRSDAAESAIAVVTIHRSKGLEYPVVICPSLWSGERATRGGSASVGRRWTPPGSRRPRFDLHLNPHWGVGRDAARQHAEAERQEAERKAYVACTRARQLLVLGWPGADQAQEGNPLSPWLIDSATGMLRELPLQPLDPSTHPPAGARWRPAPPRGELKLGRTPSRSLDSRWGRASYSAWTHGAAALPPEARDEGRDRDALSPDGDEVGHDAGVGTDPAPAAWPALGPLAPFPCGAAAGDTLHRILEQIDYPALASGHVGAAQALVQRELQRSGLADTLAAGVLEALQQLVHTPLGGALGEQRLADLQPGGWINEMGFDLPLAHLAEQLVRSSGLAQVFQRHPGGRFGGAYAQRLQGLDVASRGFLTGSIDLVFSCGERWWVADWKSNFRGQRDERGLVVRCGPGDYGDTALEQLMAEAHYPLQAHLYLVALHRYLRWRLPSYAPERHLGGYAYVFLRGVPGALAGPAPATVPGVLVEPAPLQRLLALDQLLREGQP
jgi:exodeoxyribonuclease V beta subunit